MRSASPHSFLSALIPGRSPPTSRRVFAMATTPYFTNRARFNETFIDSHDGESVPIKFVQTSTEEDLKKAVGSDGAGWLQASAFKAKPGDIRLVPNFSQPEKVSMTAMGAETSSDHWTYAALPAKLPTGIYTADAEVEEEVAKRLVLGWGLGAYSFDRYQKPKEDLQHPKLVLPFKCNRTEVRSVLEAMYFAQDMINTPAEDLGPEELVAEAVALAEHHEAEVTVISGDDLLEKGYPAVHTVGRASSRPPHLVDIRWKPKESSEGLKLVSLVGKGVTFDTGGLNIKPGPYMIGMKSDMGGAALMLALAHVVMNENLPVQLRVLIPAVENSVSGNSYRPSDVVQTRSGITVENMNSDAEGRLILCDSIFEAAKESPDLLIDSATLTGDARVGLGELLPALFSSDPQVAADILAAGVAENDQVWQLPLHKAYRKKLDSKIAEVASVGQGMGGAITAALFLQEFVKDTPRWVHLDTGVTTPPFIAGPGRSEGAEALTLRALWRFLHDRYAVSATQ